MRKSKISVLIPVYNAEKYLVECLDSVVRQTLRDIEIICINDGSTDNSLQTIRRYAKDDPRFVIIDKKNSGYGDSMNKGLAKATGDYIGIVESDDFIDANMFEELYRLAVKHDAEVVKSNFYYYYTDLTKNSAQWEENLGGIYNREQQKYVKEHDTRSNILREDELGRVIDTTKYQHILYQKPAIWSAIYNRDFLSRHDITFLPSPGASYQDTAFSFKVWSNAKRVVFTDDAFLHYRQDNEASSVNSPGKVFCVCDEYREIESYLKKKKLSDKFGSLAQKTKYGAYMWNFNRLSDGLDAEFLEQFSKEYAEADKSGILDWFYFDINERRDLKEIIHKPDMFLARKRARRNAKVSVIVPVYNVEKYLRKCLDSLVKQSLRDIEIICVNDGSPDDSILILEEYRAEDPRIIIRETPNRGLSAARNHGMARASSDFIMFCDSDDSYAADACHKMYQAITKYGTDIAISGVHILYSNSEFAKAYRQTDEEYFRLRYSGKVSITDTVIERTDVSAWNKIYRTAVQRKYELWFPKGMWYEDAKFFVDYMLVSRTAFYLDDEKLYNYYRREDSIMAATTRQTPRAIDHVRVMIESFYFMKQNNLLDDHYQLFVRLFSKYYLLSKRHMPRSAHEKLHDLVREFLKKNRSYLNTIDPSITKDIQKLLPHVPRKTQAKRAVKRAVKKPVIKVMSMTSPNWRRQSIIMTMITDLERKVDAVDKKHSDALAEIKEEMRAISSQLAKKDK